MANPARTLSTGATTLSVPNSHQQFPPSPIAGSVLPIRRAEELLATLPGVIAARIVASESGAVDEIHVLTTSEVTAKQTVRNVESALIAHLGMRVDHRKISVATTIEPPKPREPVQAPEPAAVETVRAQEPVKEPVREAVKAPVREAAAPQSKAEETSVPTSVEAKAVPGRQLLFDSVQVQRSRAEGVTYRVTLRKGAESFVGESGGFEDEQRTKVEHVARAALEAIRSAEGDDRHLVLEGCRVVEAFERTFAFAGVTAREGRDAALLTGSCEIKESPETSAVLAVLDATNRWIERAE